MFEEIKEELTTLFKLPIKEITYEEINYKLRSYEGIKYCDDYGNLLHAVVSNKYDEEKTFKFIEELLSHGYDVNYKNKSNNHNFIQWAFYGYIENDKHYSYSTEFIVKLINIAKKYGLDVNAKDSYGSNIIHMALDKSTYEGQVFPLLDALGENFDFECKDRYGRNLLEIIDDHKNYTKVNHDNVWFNRWVEEEQEFKKRILRKENASDDKTKNSSFTTSKVETDINTFETTKNLDNYADTDETVKDVISEKKEISGDDKCERKQVEKMNKTIKSLTDSKKEPIENQQLIIKEKPNIDLPTIVGSEIDLSKLSLLELKQLSENIVNMINIKKQEAITERQNKLEESIDAMLALEETGLYERSELEESIENVFSKKVKIKCRNHHNN